MRISVGFSVRPSHCSFLCFSRDPATFRPPEGARSTLRAGGPGSSGRILSAPRECCSGTKGAAAGLETSGRLGNMYSITNHSLPLAAPSFSSPATPSAMALPYGAAEIARRLLLAFRRRGGSGTTSQDGKHYLQLVRLICTLLPLFSRPSHARRHACAPLPAMLFSAYCTIGTGTSGRALCIKIKENISVIIFLFISAPLRTYFMPTTPFRHVSGIEWGNPVNYTLELGTSKRRACKACGIKAYI